MRASKKLKTRFLIFAFIAILISQKAFTQSNGNDPLYMITYKNIGGAKWTYGYPVKKSFSEHEHIILPTANEISLEGCTFGGWFDNDDYSGKQITEIKEGTTDNITLHAMWIEYATSEIAPNLTALSFDNKLQISWKTSSDENYADTDVYIIDKGVRQKIGTPENHSSSIYGKYSFFCYEGEISNSNRVEFEIHAARKSIDKEEKSNKTTNDEAKKIMAAKVTLLKTRLPIVNIDTEDSKDVANRVKKVPATINILNANELKNPEANAMLTIKARGTSSWGQMAKKSYTLKLNEKSKILGMKKNKSWAMIANHSDKTLLRNSIAYEIGRDIFTNMEWTPNTQNVHFYLNGCYLGLYMISETPKIDGKRVNVPNIKKCKDIETANDYGFLLEVKAENRWETEEFNFKTANGVCFTLNDPDKEDLNIELRKKIQEITQRAENALYSKDFDDKTSKNYFENFFDTDSFIDWWIVNEIAKNTDAAFFYSCFVYFNPTDQKLYMGPVWDFDIGFGNVNYSNTDKINGFRIKNAAWIGRMFKSPEFTKKAKARWNEKYPEILEYFNSDMKKQFTVLSYDAKQNFIRWPIFGTYVWPNPDGYEERKTYESECEYLSNWISERLQWLDTAINAL